MNIFADITSDIWILAVISAAAVLVMALVIVFIRLGKCKKKRKKEPLVLADRSVYISSLGGEENIVESKVIGSRIVIVLKDDSIIAPEKLLEAGVASYIKMNKKLTLVVKDNADKVYERIFPTR